MLRDQEEQGKRDEGEAKQEDPELGERSRRIKKKMEKEQRQRRLKCRNNKCYTEDALLVCTRNFHPQ